MSNTEAPPQPKARLTGRALAVFGVTFSFAAILLSGGILLFAPKGRISSTTGWEALGLDRQGWGDLHIVLAALFAGFSLWHAALHLPVFKSLLAGSKTAPQGHRTEALIALAAVLALAVLTLLQLPPASWLLDLNGYFKHVFWAR
ncbi:DUF4405 domain-containing protein (plasmid) [Leisingera aquaemixtae]|uniref:DUF4405 domain-containing protein n=1 Tax=Leisingera aquaemixtae TaxID=1396826 RepID=UPI0021A2FBC3|nr:DUF4405 domain-containing protein [Leisingera aquaemixtae]UWQ27168.1 DUF4405 domain-containing protein [Leisingera aquaemixtae]